MIEFQLRSQEDLKADTTAISFVSWEAFEKYVKQVGEVRLIADSVNKLVMVVPYGK